MPRRKSSRLDDLLASAQAESWRAGLAAAFFDAEAREQALDRLREQLRALEPPLSAEECEEVERLTLTAASLRAAPPTREAEEVPCTGEALADRVIHSYPYPVSRPFLALTEAEPGAGGFGCLLDTLEGLVHFLAVVAVCAYQRGGLASPECSRQLAERFLKGLWSTGDLFALLRDTVRLAGDCGGHLPYAELPAYLFDARGKPTASARVLESFVALRNRLWGHGTGRTDAVFAEALPANRRRLEEELARMGWLASWDLVRPTVIDASGSVHKADLLTGFRRRRDLDFRLTLREEDLDVNGGCVRAEKSLLLVSGDRARYLPLFPLSLYGVKPNRRDGVFLLQGCQWQRPGHPRRLKEAAYVSYEAGLGAHTEPANDLAASRIERLLEQLTAWTNNGAAPAPAAPEGDPDCELPELRQERESHLRSFVGRDGVLREVGEWIDRTTAGGYLLLLGPPGQGKSALMAELTRRESEAERGGCLLHMMKTHRDPRRFVPALLSQAARLAGVRFGEEAYRGELQDLRGSLVRALETLVERTGRAVVLLDALDELAAGELGGGFEPLLEFLPPSLPEGARVVLTCRPDLPLVEALRAWVGGLEERPVPPLSAADFGLLLERRLEAGMVRALQRELDFTALFDRLGGNPLFLRAAVDRIAREVEQAAAENRPVRLAADELPNSYAAFFRDVYHHRIAEKHGTRWTSPEGRTKARLLELLCVAREPLGFEELAGLLAGDGMPLPLEECRDRLDEMSQFLLDYGGGRFKPWHQGLTDYVRAEVLGAAGVRAVEESFCRWLRRDRVSRYALTHRVRHLLAAGRPEEAADLLTDLPFLEARAAAGLIFDLAADFDATADALPEADPRRRLLHLLEEALRTDLHFIARHPESLFQCLWNRCWWYDSPEAAAHHEPGPASRERERPEVGVPPSGSLPNAGPPEGGTPTLAALLESWRAVRERERPGAPWLRSRRPPPYPLGGPVKAVLRGHEGAVAAVAFSPDGRRLASASKDGTVRVWDAASGAQRLCLRGHGGWVQDVAFSPDGRRLASGSVDRTIRLWDADTGSPLGCLRGHLDWIQGITFSPDGRLLASADDAMTVRVWDIARQGQVAHFSGQAVSSVAFLPDGKRLMIGTAEGPALVRDVAGARRMVHLHGHEGRIAAVAVSADGRVATAGVDGTARVWDPDRGVELACLRHPVWQRGDDPEVPYAVSGVAFSPDGRRLVTGSGDRTVRVWDVERGTELACLHGHEARVWGVAFSPDGRLLASASYDRTVRIWGAGGGAVHLALRNHQWTLWALAFSQDGRLLATGAEDRTVRLWDVESGLERACLAGHESTVRSLAFAPAGSRLASGSEDGALGVWDLAGAAPPAWLRGHTGAVLSIAFAPDGGRIASGSWDGTVRLWDAGGGGEIHCLRGAADRVWAVGFSPDGKQVWADCADGTVRAWDAHSGAAVDPAGIGQKGGAAGRWRLAARGLETAIETAVGEAVAWLPMSLAPVLAHPSGRTWAAAAGTHLCLFTLEGDR